MKKINTITVVIIAFVSFFFISCGGEGPDDPIDTDPVDDTGTTDDTVVVDDTEPVDNEMPDDVQTDDIIDEEPTDTDTVPVPCDQDETCKEICKNFLDFAGDWSIVEPTDVSGTVLITLSINGSNCRVALTGRWSGLVWEGTETPLGWAQDSDTLYFFSLRGMEGEKMVIERSRTEEIEVDLTYKFEKIQ